MDYRNRLAVMTIALGLCAPALAAEPTTRPAIRVTNYRSGEKTRYTVPLLRGELADREATSVVVVNTSSDRDTREIKGLAHRGRFKALTELVPGVNKLIIRAGDSETPLTLVYRPQTNPYFVRCVYMTDNTGKTDFQTPDEKDPQNYAERLDTVMKIIQTFTAERHHDLGFGRRTFNLELDDRGKVKVHVFKGTKPASFYYGLDDQAWYARVAQEMDRSFHMERAKNVVVVAYTRFDPATGKTRGHTALGGGWMGLFGSGNMFTWPGRLADVQAAFMDARPIDAKKTLDDSAFRATYWGAASTTIGATLHELTHTFDIPHSREPMDIMTRGFDQFNRVFTFADPPCAGNPQAVEFSDEEVACFPPITAAALMPNPWFALDDPDSQRPTASLDDEGRNIVVTGQSAVRYVGFDVNGDAVYHVVPKEGSLRVVLPLAQIREKVKSDKFNVRILDDRGRFAVVEDLLAGPFVTRWQFATITKDWDRQGDFVPLSEAGLREIQASAAASPPVNSEDRFVDFAAQVPAARTWNVTGYAYRTIRVDKAMKVRLLTGSDDALRVWLNSQQVVKVLAMRGAEPDADKNEVELTPGENHLLVEVSQGNGGWGLCLRFEDSNGKALRLTDAGQLIPATDAH